MVERVEALNLVKKYVKNKNLIKHMLATEAVMGALAKRCEADVDSWRLAGLVHDLDYDQTAEEPEQHGIFAAKMLKELNFPAEIIQAVRAHNGLLGYERISSMDHALYAADPVTGLIVAAALIHPHKKLTFIDAKFVLNRFDEKHFARGASREQIKSCSQLNLELEEFVGISLEAMQNTSGELGL